MVSDEELEQHIRTAEQRQEAAAPVESRLEEMESTARHVHNELARRIEAVDEDSVAREEMTAIQEAVARLEHRLDTIEERLDERPD